MQTKGKPGDWLVGAGILAAAVLCLLFWRPGVTAQTAKLSVDGQDQILSLEGLVGETVKKTVVGRDGLTVTLELGKGQARIVHADCPDKDCVHAGWLTRPKQAAVCVPARIVLELEGVSELDAVTG